MSEDTADISTPSMSRRRLLQLMVAGGATMAMSGSLLAACGSDDDGGADASGVGNSGSSGAAPTSGGSSPFTADEFVIATDNEPGDMLPGWGGGFGAAIALQGIYQNLFEPRIAINEQHVGTVEMEPVLATGFEQVDDLRWRFTLREGVVFHNGEKFDANAVKTNFDMQTDEAFLTKYDRSNNLGQAIEACEVVDDMTVDFVAALPDSEIPNSRLRGLLFLPPKLLREQGFDPFVEKPMGTGPYRFESWTRGQEIRLTRFEDYWDEDGPNMPVVRVIVRPETAVRAQTVATGEAHLAYSIGGELAQTPDDERRMIEACSMAGGADGAFSRTSFTIDGIDGHVSMGIVGMLGTIIRNGLMQISRPF